MSKYLAQTCEDIEMPWTSKTNSHGRQSHWVALVLTVVPLFLVESPALAQPEEKKKKENEAIRKGLLELPDPLDELKQPVRPGGFASRNPTVRKKMLEKYGGNAKTTAAVAMGLEFLALHQNPQGSWSLNDFHKDARTMPLPGGKRVGDQCTPQTTRHNLTAGTALALLPFLAAGITHKVNAEQEGAKYRVPVEMGIQYLLKKQSQLKADRGYFGGDQYSHAIATIAICEAYGMTADPKLKAPAQAALDYIKNAQHEAGGWRYSPKQAGDTSVTAWQVTALKTGQTAGLTVPKTVFEKAGRFLDSVEVKQGSFGYVPGAGATPALTAAGLYCRQMLGVDRKNPALEQGAARLLAQAPGNTPNLYYAYYATQFMYHMGGETWLEWNLGSVAGRAGLRESLLARQDTGANEPGQRGSFSGDDHVGGRLGATALSLVCLQAYYRHVSLYRPKEAAKQRE